MADTEMTVAQLREWLRNWIAEATGQPVAQISDDRPMEEFGLSSRDAVALSGEVEELLGVTLTATIAYQHPTIASLATRIIEGEPELPEGDDSAFYAAGPAGRTHDVAIVGLAARLPGHVSTPAEMWELLAQGRDGITDLPEGRWSEFADDPQISSAIAAANTRGGYLDDVKGFDAEFFAMSPREVEMVDPQQRLALELTWEALEHAHIPASDLKGRPVGVFIGSSANDYQLLAVSDPSAAHPYALTGTATSIVANRVSYFFDFRGPSVALDTACSSSLVAVHQAVRALRDGDADVALAGGVNMLVAPAATLGFDQLGVQAPDGCIKAFSADADGMVRAEGGGLVVLKRLEDAERDGDTVLAVIAGSAVNQDGRSNGLAAPNPEAQVDVLRRAYRDARILPSGVDYIEAHGTGTVLGDPIEADALGRVVGRGRDADKPVLLGSAKTNFGHLEAAAGAAGLIKVVLAMQENHLPATLNYTAPNPYIPFEQARLKVIPEGAEWPRYTGKAIAGVSGFGFGGTNAHVVVREYTGPEADAESSERIVPSAEGAEGHIRSEQGEEHPVLLAVSAAMPSRRRRAAADLADWLETEAGSTTPLADVARTLSRRNHGRSRAVVIAKTRAEAIAGLRAVAAGKPAQGVFSADAPAANGPVWVLSGFGSQHRKMAKQLYLENPVFAAAVDEIDELIEDEAGYSMKEKFLDDGQDYNVETSQVGIFTIQVALAKLLRHHGAEPSAVVGHSMGEAAAAYISGGLSLEDSVRVICARSRLMGEAEALLEGDDIRLMALVEYSAAEIELVLTDYPHLEVCVYAAPTHTVIGGPQDEVNAIVARAESEEKLARVLQTKGASHTSQVDPLLGELAAELAGIEPHKPKVDVYSSVDQDTHYRIGHDPIHQVEYWTKGLRHSVYFTNAVKLAVTDGHTTFVELAPNPVALMSVAATAYAAGVIDTQLIQTLKRKEDEPLGVLTALAQLYVHGHAVDLRSLLPAGEYADLPRTVFLRKPFWLETRIGTGGNARVPGAHVALPDGRHVWEVRADAVTDLGELVVAAASQTLADVTLTASVPHGDVPTSGTLTTTLTRHPGGASLHVHGRDTASGEFRLLFDAVVVSGEALPAPAAAPAPAERSSGPVETLPEVVETFGDKWNPAGSQTLEDRLALIVAESMGYAPEDLPVEIPLIELGLDSLMAVRIKNRVEYEFDIPQLQLAAVKDASLRDVAKYLRYAVENREEVAALAAQQAADRETAQREDTTLELPPISAVEDTGVVHEAEAILEAAEAAEAAEAGASTEADKATDVTDRQAVAEASGTDVPPRDAAERLTFATWAVITGQSAKGIFNTLPILDDETAERLAARLTERANGEITVDDVLDAETIEQLAESVRRHLESADRIDGLVRTLRPRPEGSDAVPVFVFHPAGGSTVVYEPLLRRLPEDTPMYGFERTEGPIEKRAQEYLPQIKEIQGDGPYVLYGWSLGGVLAYAVAKLLRAEGKDVRLVGLIDTVMAGEKVEDTPEEITKRWQRYARFAKKTYGVDAPLPYDKLAATDDEGQVRILMDLLKMSGTRIPGGIIEHQRTSWLDNRAIQTAKLEPYDGDVVLYMADRYHDDAIELEPAFGTRQPDGGWGEAVRNLEVIHVGGDHLQVVDEPYIGKVGADLTRKLADIEATRS